MKQILMYILAMLFFFIAVFLFGAAAEYPSYAFTLVTAFSYSILSLVAACMMLYNCDRKTEWFALFFYLAPIAITIYGELLG